MSNASGIGIEFEQMGMVALIGLLLIPGVIWVSKAKSGGSMAVRSAVVGGVIVGAILLEAAMDDTANTIADAV